MKLRINSLLFCCFVIFVVSCSIESQPINYGIDECHFCKMTVVDRQYGSELVTKKGKVFIYDAIECMVNDIKNRNEADIALFLVTDYERPGGFINALEAIYLISKNLPSPMGANLTAFKERQSGINMQNDKSGDLFKWAELKDLF